MKFIKGIYERNLRTHESIQDYDYEIGDYYLQYDYPNSYLVDLCQVRYNQKYYELEDEEKADVSIYDTEFVDNEVIKTFNNDYVKNLSVSQLRDMVIESMGNKKEQELER